MEIAVLGVKLTPRGTVERTAARLWERTLLLAAAYTGLSAISNICNGFDHSQI